MKVSILLFLGAAFFFRASSTFAGDTISFTNNDEAVLNAEVVKIKSGLLIYRLQDGGAGSIPLKSLPPDVQKKYGYEPPEAKTTAAPPAPAQPAATTPLPTVPTTTATPVPATARINSTRNARPPTSSGASLPNYGAQPSATTYSPRSLARERDPITYRSNPIRQHGTQKMNFSEGIAWIANEPPRETKYTEGTAMYAEWQTQRGKFQSAYDKWARYLCGATLHDQALVSGHVIESRPEGLVIEMIVYEMQPGSVRRQGSALINTSSERAVSKQILLMNVPDLPTERGGLSEQINLPVFAFPAGFRRCGSVTLEAFDYGKPVK